MEDNKITRMSKKEFLSLKRPNNLKRVSKEDKFTCLGCKNQTFILTKVSDFPFVDVLCSKCGSQYIA